MDLLYNPVSVADCVSIKPADGDCYSGAPHSTQWTTRQDLTPLAACGRAQTCHSRYKQLLTAGGTVVRPFCRSSAACMVARPYDWWPLPSTPGTLLPCKRRTARTPHRSMLDKCPTLNPTGSQQGMLPLHLKPLRGRISRPRI